MTAEAKALPGSERARNLVLRYGLRLIADARDQDIKFPSWKPGEALQEMHDAAEPVMAFIAELEQRIAALEANGSANADSDRLDWLAGGAGAEWSAYRAQEMLFHNRHAKGIRAAIDRARQESEATGDEPARVRCGE